MTLKEAIESNLPFKRESHQGWYQADKKMFEFSRESLMATDWIVKREPLVFECEWEFEGRVACIYSLTETEQALLLGKKTRVTVEVIGE